jgi:hypothetical protein
MGKKLNACRVLVGKPEAKRPIGRHRLREDYDITEVFGRSNRLLSFDTTRTA